MSSLTLQFFSRRLFPVSLALVATMAAACSRTPVYRSSKLEKAFHFDGIDRVGVYSICHRDFKLCEVFVTYKSADISTFENLVQGLALSSGGDPTSVVRGAKDLPDSLNWYSDNYIQQATRGRLHSRKLTNPQDPQYDGYIACYVDGDYIYLYARGWREDLISEAKGASDPGVE